MNMDSRIALDIDRLHHAYTPQARVLHDVRLKVARGQIVSLVGPSGCGKSTLLRAILGTLKPSQGQVATWRATPEGLVRQVVERPGRDRGIVYQRYALFPHLTALDNVALGLMLDETGYFDRMLRWFHWRDLRAKHLELASAMLEKVGLADARNKYPSELSGGMQQRVAIAQALVMKPEILLLDEPFGALDEATREELQEMLLLFYEENMAAVKAGQLPTYTVLIVTHELNEAIYVGDRIIGLSQYWDWKAAGLEQSPGATIVYDVAAPIYSHDTPKDHAEFVEQREEIRRVVFEPEVLVDPTTHVTFWDQVAAGSGEGVLGS